MSTRTSRSAAADVGREQWSSQLGFLMAAIGSAVGLGNIWRFPGVAYTNGGGAFIIPYIVALLFVGIPILFLDYSLGHRYRGSAPTVFRRLARRFEWLGWWQVFICFIIMSYYAVIVAWALRYTLFAINEAWGNDAEGFFTRFISVGELTESGTPVFSATPVAGVAIPLAIVWIFGIVVIGLGVTRGVERANRFFMPILVVMFVALVIRALFLPGAMDGLNALFTPRWSSLTDYRVWMAAFGQIFFSLSVGFGIMLTYASYLRKRSNLVGTGLVAAFANSSFEILAGIGVFATLGFMMQAQGTNLADAGISGISLSFITFPTVISQMPGGAVFGVLFFASFSMAGMTSFISIIQVVSPAIAEKFNLTTPVATVVVSLPAAALSFLLFGTASGEYNLDIVDAFINNIGVVGSAIIMCVGVGVVLRRTRTLQRHLDHVSETNLIGAWWRVLVSVVVPILLGYMFVQTAWSYVHDGYAYSPSFELVLGWGTLFVGAVLVAVLTLLPWRTPVDDFVPLELSDRKRTRRAGSGEEARIATQTSSGTATRTGSHDDAAPGELATAATAPAVRTDPATHVPDVAPSFDSNTAQALSDTSNTHDPEVK
ncbi:MULTISPECIES: sodium-dependent transporter [unclassified Actinobaculum]|uniref:sodium-dependent transporter n=1 Tax=unclassified Actinobaculum TaxID=2609299 RepID=UPI000D527E99|nr:MULTISPECIES: sodium-dependent transporter [unclassified Actinobaculum]AWE41900.1 sodium-dependent transporter [Actinobaculum sp. 313]RTE50184.1 sodium-dependent transporter [Actinobaculum sp. 352]